MTIVGPWAGHTFETDELKGRGFQKPYVIDGVTYELETAMRVAALKQTAEHVATLGGLVGTATALVDGVAADANAAHEDREATEQAAAVAINAAEAALAAVGGVRASANDTTAGPLSSKLEAGTGVAFSVVGGSGNEKLRIDASSVEQTAPVVLAQNGTMSVAAKTILAVFEQVAGSTFGVPYTSATDYIMQDASKMAVNGGVVTLHNSGGGGIDPNGANNTSTTSAVPVMTGNTAPAGTVFSDTLSSGPVYLVFNGNTSDYVEWATGSGHHIGYQFGSARIINKVGILPRSGGWTARAPGSFLIQGSNDGSNYTTLATVTGVVASDYSDGGFKHFTFSNSTPYAYWRLGSIAATASADNVLSIGEIRFIEAQNNLPVYPTGQSYYIMTSATSQISLAAFESIDGVVVTQSTPAGTSIRYLVSFDGCATWKYWTGSAWVATTPTAIDADGMSGAAMEAALPNWSRLQGLTLDFVAALKTTDSTASPSLDNISVTMDRWDGLQQGVDWSLQRAFSSGAQDHTVKRLKTGAAPMVVDYLP